MFEDLTPPSRRQICKLAKLAETLDETDRLILWAAVGDLQTWGTKTLATSLTQRGFVVSPTPIHSHRTKACGCFA